MSEINKVESTTDGQKKQKIAPWEIWTTVAAIIGFVTPLFYFGWHRHT